MATLFLTITLFNVIINLVVARSVQHKAKGDTMPWWGVALVGVGCAAVGGGVVYVGAVVYLAKVFSHR